MAFGGGSGGTGDTGSGPGRSEGRNRDNGRGGRSGGRGDPTGLGNAKGLSAGIGATSAPGAGGVHDVDAGRGLSRRGEVTDFGGQRSDSLIDSIAKGVLSGIAGLAGTALTGNPAVGAVASLGVDEALSEVSFGLGDLSIGQSAGTGVSRRSPVPGRDDNRQLLGPGAGGAPQIQEPPQAPQFQPSNTTRGQGGVNIGGQRSGRTGRIPANQDLFSSLANTTRKSLLGV